MMDRMTLRDSFAAAALAGMLADPSDAPCDRRIWTDAAYSWADAMLAARDRARCGQCDHLAGEHHDAHEPCPAMRRRRDETGESV